MKKIKKWFENNLSWLIVVLVGLLCAAFLAFGTVAEDGTVTLNGESADIKDYTKAFIEDANETLNRIMNQDRPTDSICLSPCFQFLWVLYLSVELLGQIVIL